MAQSRKYNLTLTASQRPKMRAALGGLSTYLSKSIDIYNVIPVDKRELFLLSNPILSCFIKLAEKVDK